MCVRVCSLLQFTSCCRRRIVAELFHCLAQSNILLSLQRRVLFDVLHVIDNCTYDGSIAENMNYCGALERRWR